MTYSLADAVHRERASELMARYPKVSEDEAREILQFVRTGRHLDTGLLSSDDRMRRKLESVMKYQDADPRVNWREGAAVAGGLVVLLITAWLIWAALAEAAFALAGVG